MLHHEDYKVTFVFQKGRNGGRAAADSPVSEAIGETLLTATVPGVEFRRNSPSVDAPAATLGKATKPTQPGTG